MAPMASEVPRRDLKNITLAKKRDFIIRTLDSTLYYTMLYINLHCISCWRNKYFTKQKDDGSSFQLTFFSPKFSVFFVSNLPKRARCQEVRLKVRLWESQLLSQQCGEGKFEIGVLWSTEWGAILTMKKNNAKKNKHVFFRMPFNLIYSSKIHGCMWCRFPPCAWYFPQDRLTETVYWVPYDLRLNCLLRTEKTP